MQPPPCCFFLYLWYTCLQKFIEVCSSPTVSGCGAFLFVITKIVCYSFCYACLNIFNSHLSCTVRLTIQLKELFKGQVFKAFWKQFLGKIGIYDHLPIAHKAALEPLLGILYSFFTDVVSASPSIRRSLSARLIVIAGYSSTVSLSMSLCSSMMLSKAKLLDAFVTELDMVFTYLS